MSDRKTKRKVKRERYVKSFQHKYGMTREEWRAYKKANPEAAEKLRQKAAKL
jgi:hypothetical protein